MERLEADPSTEAPRSTRRSLFKTGAAAAGAAAGAVVAAPLFADPASAGLSNPLYIDETNSSVAGGTRLNADTGEALTDNIFTAADGGSGSSFPAAVGAFAFGNRLHNGVYAYSDSRENGESGTGHAIIAKPTTNARSHMHLMPVGSDPRADAYSHSAGEVRAASNGDLWYCVASGTPGTWQKLAGSSATGAVHAIAPVRAYDSRVAGSPLAGGSSRIVSVADAVDATTGSVIQSDVVPVGATSVNFNITITRTVGSGHLSVNPGDVTIQNASTINWFASNQTVANGSLSKLDSARQLKIIAGGGGSTDFIIDITAYSQ